MVLACWLVLLLGGAVVVSIGGWDPEDLPITAQVAALTPFWLCGLGLSWWVARRSFGAEAPDARSVARRLGLVVRPLDLPVGIAVGLGVQFAVIPVVYRLVPGSEDLDEAARRLSDSAPGTVGTVLFVLMACVMAPVVEEILYRALLQRSTDWPHPAVAVGATSLVFAASHLQGLQFLGLLLFGLSVGALTWRTGRVGPAIVAHVAFNAGTVVVLLLDR